MAFSTKSQKMIAGSLNLSAPGDLIPAGDAVTMQNWRVDSKGILRSRLREATTQAGFQIPISNLFMHEINGVPYRYVGDSTDIWRGTQVLAVYNGKACGFVSYIGYVWILNPSVAGRDNGTGTSLITWVPLPPAAAPTVVADAPTGSEIGITGAYEYFVSFATSDNIESNLSPTSAQVTLAAQTGLLTAIPTSMDPSVVTRYIYRVGGQQDQLYRVATISDNTTTTYRDTMTDVGAAQLGITHTLDHYPPPAGALGLSGPYYDYLFSWVGNTLYWTKQAQPAYWPGVTLAAGNHAPVGEDGEPIVAVTIKPNYVLIYKERSIWRLRGDPSTFTGDLERLSIDTGLIGPKAIAAYGYTDYFQGAEGIYQCNGVFVQKVSGDKMDPLFKGDALNWFAGTAVGQIPSVPLNTNPAIRSLNVIGQRNGRIYFSYADQNSIAPNTTLVMEIDTGRFVSDSRAFTALYDEGPVYNFAGAMGANTVSIEALQVGSAIPVSYVSHFDNQQSPRNGKVYADLEIENTLTGADVLNVTAYYDFGKTTELLGTLVAGARAQQFRFSAGNGTRGKNIAIGVSGSLANLGFIHGFHLRYHEEQRDALTFDTNVVELFGGSYGQVLSFAGEGLFTGNVNWTLYADAPTGDSESSQAGIIQLGTLVNRRPFQVPLGYLQEGKGFRLVFTSPSPFQIYSLRFNGRAVPNYLVYGDLFSTLEMDFGTERQKLFKRIEVDAEIDNQMECLVWDDQKGPVEPITTGFPLFTTFGKRQWTKLSLPNNTRGRLLRIELGVNGISRLYAIRVWYKPMGEASESSWRWGEVPIPPTPAVFSWIPVEVDK